MSEIQRYYVQNPPGQPTEFVAYEDHVAALRACEQRVTDQVNREWAEISVDDEVRIWNEAIDSAREAVLNAGLCAPHRCQSDALAAINALREEQK